MRSAIIPEDTMAPAAVTPGRYRHYKGNEYRVIAVAKHSETLEDLVVYEACYANPVSRVWVRPLSLFTEYVAKDGAQVPRFTYIGE